MEQSASEKGRALRRQLWGEERVEQADDYLGAFDAEFAGILNDTLFGTVWSRPGLPLKTRSMITMAALMALGRSPELKLHMRAALNIGISADEIKELIIHLALYSGVPTAVEAIRVFNDVVHGKREKKP